MRIKGIAHYALCKSTYFNLLTFYGLSIDTKIDDLG